MLALAQSSMLPAWVVMPPAALLLLVMAGHVMALQEAPMPVRRRRLRSVNGVLMMFVTALLAFALGIMPHYEETTLIGPVRAFLFTWLMITGLLAIVLVLAGLDIGAGSLEMMRARRDLRRRLRIDLERAVRSTMLERGVAGRDDARG